MKQEIFLQHRDLEDRHWWFVGRRRVLDPLIRAAMESVEKDLVLDLGCGTGGTVAALSSRFECLGVDLSPDSIAIAKAKYPACAFSHEAIPDVLSRAAHRTALFLLMDVLEHVEDDRRYLADVVKASRPGSHILITVPANPLLWSAHDVAAGHKRRYTMHTLADLWRELPVQPRVLSYYNVRLYPLILLIRVIGKRLGLFQGDSGSDLSMPPEILNRTLTKIFSGERYRIEKLLRDSSAAPFVSGVSLVALLRRTDGIACA
jgi:SAM-dependent methyltransferase